MSLATEEALAEEFNTKATLQLPQLKATAPTAPHDATSSDPSSSGKVTYLPDNRVDMAIKQALEDNKERTTVLSIEEQVERFILDTKQQQLEFPGSFTNYQRMLAHRIAQHYGLQTSTVDYEEGPGRVIARRTPWCRMPKIKLRELKTVPHRSGAGIPKVLVRRPAVEDAAARPGGAPGPNSLANSTTPPASAKEREEEYHAARERIIGKSLEIASARNFSGRGNSRSAAGRGQFGPAGVGAQGQGPRSPGAAAGRGRKAVLRDREKEMQDPDYRRSGSGRLGGKDQHVNNRGPQEDVPVPPAATQQPQPQVAPQQLAHDLAPAKPQLHVPQQPPPQQQQLRPQVQGGHPQLRPQQLQKPQQEAAEQLQPQRQQRQRQEQQPQQLQPDPRQPQSAVAPPSRAESRATTSRPSTSASNPPPLKTPSPLPPTSPAHSSSSSTTWRGGSGNNIRAPPPPPLTPPKAYPQYANQPYTMGPSHPYSTYNMQPYHHPMASLGAMPYHPAMAPSLQAAPGMSPHPGAFMAQYPGFPYPQYAMLPPGAEGISMATSPYQYYAPYSQMAYPPQFAAAAMPPAMMPPHGAMTPMMANKHPGHHLAPRPNPTTSPRHD